MSKHISDRNALAIGIIAAIAIINIVACVIIGLIAAYSYIFTGHTFWVTGTMERFGVLVLMTIGIFFITILWSIWEDI